MAYSINVPQERNGKTYWTRIGTMFEMDGGKGFSLVFNALPIPQLKDGKLEVRAVAFPPKDDAGGSRDDNEPPPF